MINSCDRETEYNPLYKEDPRRIFIKSSTRIQHNDPYYEILVKYLRKLTVACGTVELDSTGIALTHRIWVGKALSREQISDIKSANLALEKIWIDSKTHKNESVTHCIWTNRNDLLKNHHGIEGIVFRDIETLFDAHNELYKYYLSFMAHKEYAFVSDLARIQACCKYGGLFMGISWKNDYQRNAPKFVLSMNTVKVFTAEEDHAFIITSPFVSTPNKELEGYLIHQYRNFSVKLSSIYYVDSEILYFGRPRHLLAILIAKKQEQYLNEMGQKKVPHVLKNYRESMYKNLLKDWQYSTDSERFSNHISSEIRGKQIANVGLLVDVMALMQSLMDLGYYHIKPCTQDNMRRYRSAVLDKQARFNVKDVEYQMHCTTLGLMRHSSMSWLKIDLSKKLSSEN